MDYDRQLRDSHHVEVALPMTVPVSADDRTADAALARAADHILDDCLFAIGQAVGMRMSVEYDAVVWIRDHFHPKFVRAMRLFGNRWREDRDNVTSVGFMLGERAVRYASPRASIDVDAIRRASVDVERFCRRHSRRAARARGIAMAASEQPLVAGYWCPY